MPWLVREGEVLASVEIATSWRDRRKGLMGRDGLEGGLLLRPCTSVHTVGMRFDIEVAFCDEDLKVLETVRMRRWRVGIPRPGAHSVLEAEAGAFDRWRLRPGDQLEVKGDS
jgi:uncharacterized membrane protein (UPF0127 family)